MKTKIKDFEVLVPNPDGSVAERVTVQIPLKWDDELEVWVLTPEAHHIIEDTKARHMGLMLPAQFLELRQRYAFSQKQMGELFQAGEKSWTRWETGNQRPSRMVSLLIRALYEGAISIDYLLQKAGKPPITSDAAWPPQVLKQLLKKHGQSMPSPLEAVTVNIGSENTDWLKYVIQSFGEPSASSRNRFPALAAPSHAYPQPRLRNFEINEGITEG